MAPDYFHLWKLVKEGKLISIWGRCVLMCKYFRGASFIKPGHPIEDLINIQIQIELYHSASLQ